MEITIDIENIEKMNLPESKTPEMIEAYIRYNLKMFKINKVEIKQNEK